MDAEPNRPGEPNRKRPFQFSVGGLMSFATAFCVLCAMTKWAGPVGGALYVCFIITLLWHANLCKMETLFGFPVPPINFVGYCVLITIVLTVLALVVGSQLRYHW